MKTTTTAKRPVLRPSQVLRLIKQGKLPDYVWGGQYFCLKCGRETGGQTESPDFHENGGYVYCSTCKADVLYKPVFPACKGYPQGFEIDLRGERKKYPLVLRKY